MATRGGRPPTPRTRRTCMSVITRSALEASPLADLHAIASELGIDGFRRLRKADLVDRIIVQQGGEDAVAEEGVGVEDVAVEAVEAVEEEKPKRRTRGARGSRTRRKDADEDGSTDEGAGDDDVVATEDAVVEEAIEEEDAAEAEAEVEAEIEAEKPRRRSRGGRGRGRDRDRDRDEDDREEGARDRDRDERDDDREDRVVEGTVELLPNGSGFV